jgi:ComF family protein
LIPQFTKRAGRVFLRSILDFIYPPLCVSCSKLLVDGEKLVCEECWRSVQIVHLDLGLYQETRSKLVASGVVDDLVSAFVFTKEGALQHIAHALKYTGYQSIGLELGRRVGSVILAQKIQADYIVPIPLHTRKLRERGYNQAELIARGASEVTGIPVRADLVRRSRFTQSQTTLSIDERKKNVEDAFEIDPRKGDAIEGRSFILLDDVITTGATIEACGRALREAGASHVIAASSALAQ